MTSDAAVDDQGLCDAMYSKRSTNMQLTIDLIY
jgi:hypothetical protein